MVISSPCLTDIKNWLVQSKRLLLASPKQMALGKDFSNRLMVDSLPKTIWLSMHHVIAIKHWLFQSKRLLSQNSSSSSKSRLKNSYVFGYILQVIKKLKLKKHKVSKAIDASNIVSTVVELVLLVMATTLKQGLERFIRWRINSLHLDLETYHVWETKECQLYGSIKKLSTHILLVRKEFEYATTRRLDRVVVIMTVKFATILSELIKDRELTAHKEAMEEFARLRLSIRSHLACSSNLRIPDEMGRE
ncbi:hypothetical protein Tco_0294916 [Tanacetum coccineum]